MQGEDEDNPVFVRVKGSLEVGPSIRQEHEIVDNSNKIPTEKKSIQEDARRKRPLPLPSRCGSSKEENNILNAHETAETRKLSTSQLQRLVLLEQLEVLKLKKAKLQKELQANNNSSSRDETDHNADDDDDDVWRSFLNL